MSVAADPAPPRSPARAGLTAFGALVARDLHVVRHERGQFLLRTLSQPLLLVFVFTYVFPLIGQGIDVPGEAGFTDVLVPGVLAIAVLAKGIQVVALPLVQEFGYTGEIEDRVMAPVPVWGVALAKIASASLQGLLAAAIVLPVAMVVPAEPVDITISWPMLIVVAVFAPVLSAAAGMVMGTTVQPEQVPLMFSIVILPVTFLGATYFPWAALEPIPWLQWAVLLNPLVYIAEGFRLALTPQLPAMEPWAVLAGLAALTVALGWVGVRGFTRRVLS